MAEASTNVKTRSFPYACRECSKTYCQRQSLSRHRRLNHQRAPATARSATITRSDDDLQGLEALLPSPFGSSMDVSAVIGSLAAPSSSVELPIGDQGASVSVVIANPGAHVTVVDPATAEGSVVMGSPTPVEYAVGVDDFQAPQPVPPRRYAARKELSRMTSETDGRQVADLTAARWYRTPLFTSDTVCRMAQDLPSSSPAVISETAGRRFGLNGRCRATLRRRLSAATTMERLLVEELRSMLPSESSGNDALVFLHRVRTFIETHSQRPAPKVNE